ncbi:MAG: hypothetical protein IJ060_00155 [Oscillospiraceae bacterium]|nr:hypothetical protein [Oscillospiraceae bacterium]
MKQKRKKANIAPRSRLKEAMLGLTFLLSVVFAAASVCFAAAHYRMRTRCTAAIQGNNTHFQVDSGGRRKKLDESSVVIDFQTDGVFPSGGIKTDDPELMKKESVTLYYDPQNPDFYYFEGALSDTMTFIIFFAVLSAGELAFGLLLCKVYLSSLRREK